MSLPAFIKSGDVEGLVERIGAMIKKKILEKRWALPSGTPAEYFAILGII